MPDRLAIRVDSSLLPSAHLYTEVEIVVPPGASELGHLRTIVGFGHLSFTLEAWTAQAWAATDPMLRPGHAMPMTMGGWCAFTLVDGKPR